MKLRPLCTHGLDRSLLLPEHSPSHPRCLGKAQGHLGAPEGHVQALEGGMQMRHLRDGLELLAQREDFTRPPFDHLLSPSSPGRSPFWAGGPGLGVRTRKRRQLLVAPRKSLTPHPQPNPLEENQIVTISALTPECSRPSQGTGQGLVQLRGCWWGTSNAHTKGEAPGKQPSVQLSISAGSARKLKNLTFKMAASLPWSPSGRHGMPRFPCGEQRPRSVLTDPGEAPGVL